MIMYVANDKEIYKNSCSFIELGEKLL